MKLLIVIGLLTSMLAQARTLKVMSYNAHNLFDTKHDEGKNDWEYLPKNFPGKIEACNQMTSDYYRGLCLESDWTQDKFNLKISQLAKVIESDGKPDILGLSEIENKNAVSALASKLGYKKYIITNSPDHRGIDVALLFNTDADIKLVEAKEYPVTGTESLKSKPTRNILEVVLEIVGKPVSIYVNHWPSQGNPTLNRIKAAKILKKAINKRALKTKGLSVIALGDFNTLKKDFPHPFKSVLLSNYTDSREAKPAKKPIRNLISKLLRKPNIIDLHQVFMDSEAISKELKAALPMGTYFYSTEQTWNMLDRVFVSSNLMNNDKLEIDLTSYKIETPKFAVKDLEYTEENSYMFGTIIRGVPFRSNHNATSADEAGYSDHFPISFNIQLK